MKEEMEMEFPLPRCENSNRVKEAGGNPDKLHTDPSVACLTMLQFRDSSLFVLLVVSSSFSHVYIIINYLKNKDLSFCSVQLC
jgi:hypothetical protein